MRPGRRAPPPTPARRPRHPERRAVPRAHPQIGTVVLTFPLASSYSGLPRRQSGFIHNGSGKERGNPVGWCEGMLRFPTGKLNLAPRLPGGPLRTPLLVGSVIALAACSRPTGPIAIGLAGPFSQPRGASMLQAAQLAVNQINAKRGIRGRKLELRVVDDSGNEDTAVRAAEQLYADPAVVAVVGHLSSGTSLAAARVYGGGATPTPMISPSASSPDLAGISPYVFRVCPSDLQHGPQLARFARPTLGASRAGIIYINNEYGRGARRTFVAAVTRLGGTVRCGGASGGARAGRVPAAGGGAAYESCRRRPRATARAGAGRRAIRDYLARVGRGQPPYEGVTGTIAFDANGDAAGKAAVIGVVRNGRLVTEAAQ